MTVFFFGFVYTFFGGKISWGNFGTSGLAGKLCPTNTNQTQNGRSRMRKVKNKVGRETRNTHRLVSERWFWVGSLLARFWLCIFFQFVGFCVFYLPWVMDIVWLAFTLVIIGQLTSIRYRDLCVITLRRWSVGLNGAKYIARLVFHYKCLIINKNSWKIVLLQALNKLLLTYF